MIIFVQHYDNKYTNKMKVPKELTKRYRKVKERGDGMKLTKLLGFKSRFNTSTVINGSRSTTMAKVEKFKRFVEDRELLVLAITEDQKI